MSFSNRFLGGLADAAAWGALISILMKLYPNQVNMDQWSIL